MKTEVGIIGGGPSGLLLSQLLHLNGVSSVVLERQSREYVLSRIRAGVLESGTVNLLKTAQVDGNLERNCHVHTGLSVIFQDDILELDLAGLTGGNVVTVYGQTEVTKDLYQARDDMGGEIIHNASSVMPHDTESDAPYITYEQGGEAHRLDCDFIAGCDGYHGISRQSVGEGAKNEYENVYPFGWLGLLADTPPVSVTEVMYASHERGFALCSMRSETRSRYYVQVPIAENIDDWPDERFWEELKMRLPAQLSSQIITGPALEKSIAPLRSFICEPMRFGKLFLVGDAAHIVPPTGAKGLNLAVSDVYYLYNALLEYYQKGSEQGLKDYSDKALSRVWKSSRFSWYLTRLLHDFYEQNRFDDKIRQAEFNYLVSSRAAQTAFAENYVGLPY